MAHKERRQSWLGQFMFQRVSGSRKAGFTLVELVTVMVVIGILSVAGSYVFFYLAQHTTFIPNQLNVDAVASRALDVMVEGDPTAKGLRFSKAIVAVAANQVDFTNEDNQTVRYRLNTATGQILRSVAAGAETPLLGYSPAGITFSGKSGQVFQYLDANENATNNPALVRRVILNLAALSGSGNFSQWEGQSDLATAVAVQRY